ncbi:heme ABC transporter permease CcmC [Algiphilus sp.]|uniref:heme ABC transporter permease CcmC n=1 Tax=Algiphilus sp. TaxID=1872431 RepID=UPI001CA7667D|nr:heme ABC transporter permease CcmC [Algiphilus sp.]MBY8965163.1 heme ABC transporter permease CcmC [Algiphilus acroporae]MCI5063888.1 heme ABC transporter permease CcmC [Algiphilus sp.]MCI5104917.1 heme ABC transporter permease CcmC [Algiphilus sp.]
MNWTWFHKLSSPPHFHRFARRWTPWMECAAAALVVYGLIGGLILAPPDYQQGEVYRIIYVHVPAAWLSLALYSGMAVAGLIVLIWRVKLAECALISIAPVGASFTALALATGMLWGKPTWGAYWVWDARLTSELVLLFLYLGVIALHGAMSEPRAAARAAALLAVVGWVNVPIVRYSVDWWNSLHQTSSITLLGKPTLDASMLWPLFGMALGLTLFSAANVMRRMQAENVRRNARQRWVREQLEAPHV